MEEGSMKAMRSVPVTLIERDGETSMPPGGGLAMVVAGSLVFWAAMIWMVL
jgi:hypothetical protein